MDEESWVASLSDADYKKPRIYRVRKKKRLVRPSAPRKGPHIVKAKRRIKPSPRDLVVHTDGGARTSRGIASWGAVIFDMSGTLIAECAGPLGDVTSNEAEYMGMHHGIRRAHQLSQIATIHVRADSSLVVNQMNGAWQIKQPHLRELNARAKAMIETLGIDVTFTWHPRAENHRPDALCNEMMDYMLKLRAFDPNAVPRGIFRRKA